MNQYIFGLFLLFFLFGQTLFSQTESTRFRTITAYDNDDKSNNIPHNQIWSTTMDSKGFLWICTEGGLSKYNSYRFKNFKHDVKDSTSISDNFVYDFLEDSKGNCYVGTNRGFNILDRGTETFESFYYDADDDNSISHNKILDIEEGGQSYIYIVTKAGLDVFYPKKKQFESIVMEMEMFSLSKDANGNIWVGTEKGIARLDEEKKELIHFPLINKSGNNIKVFDIYEGSDGQLWIASQQGLYVFNLDSETFDKINLPNHLKGIMGLSLAEYPKGKLYVGTRENAMFRLDMKTKEVEKHFNFIDGNRFGMGSPSTPHIMVDKWGVFWTSGSGLQSINPVHAKFKVFHNDPIVASSKNGVRGVFSTKKGEVWLCTSKGVLRKDSLEGLPETVSFPPPLGQGKYVNVSSFWEDKEGLVWLTSRANGLYRQVKGESRFEAVGRSQVFKGAVLYESVEDTTSTNDDVWLGTSEGLCKFDMKTKSQKWIIPKDYLEKSMDNTINDLAMDSDKNFWFMNSNHLHYYNVTKDEMETFLPDSLDSAGNLLSKQIGNIVATEDRIYLSGKKSVSYLDRKTKRFTNITYNDSLGLKISTPAAIEIDDDGIVWIVGAGNLSSFDPKTNKIQNYLTYIYTSGNSTGSVHKTDEGDILFGCRLGVQLVEPDNLPDKDTIRPEVVLSKFELFNQENTFGKPYELLDKIDLKYYEKFFSIEFTGLKYFHQKEYWYEVKLEGYDDDWIELGQKYQMEYKDVPPGKYTFLAKAKSLDGLESLPLKISITIHPPFWKTLPFYSLIALILGIIFYLLYLNHKKNKLLTKEKEAAEQHALYKSRFLANMSHEIRTPMNAIMGLNKLMMETELNETQQKYTNVINLSCENLIWIINDILDQSKIESGKISIQSQAFNFSNLVNQLDLLLAHKFKGKELQFTIDIEEDIPSILVGDPTRLFQVLTNLIVNAIKFTEEGYIYLTVAQKERKEDNLTLHFEVIDTGIGIPEEKLDTVFQSFEQVERIDYPKDYESRGTGLGLSICKELLELQGGNIGVKSQLNMGSTFYFDLPFQIGNEEQVNSFQKIENFELPKNLSVLLVEDVPFNQFLVQENFKKHLPGSNIDLAENGEIALEKIKSKSYDIVLMDVKMPIMNGLDATRNIRLMEDTYFKTVPILGLTASVIPEQIKECIEIGMNDCVTKPLDFQKLQEKIALLLNL